MRAEVKNVWSPGEGRVGEVPLSGTFEEYENAVGHLWVRSEGEFEGGHVRREIVDGRHDVRLSFHEGEKISLMVRGSLVLDGVQLFGRTPQGLVEALGEGAEAYREPWVDEELVMVEHRGLGLLAFFSEEPYATADSIAL